MAASLPSFDHLPPGWTEIEARVVLAALSARELSWWALAPRTRGCRLGACGGGTPSWPCPVPGATAGDGSGLAADQPAGRRSGSLRNHARGRGESHSGGVHRRVSGHRVQVMSNVSIEFPPGFDDYEWEVESKGWLQGVVATIDGRRYPLTFYERTRLSQDVEEELARGPGFFEPNLIVVRSVTREHIESSVAAIVATGRHKALVPEPPLP